MTGEDLLRRQRNHDCIVCGVYIYDWEAGLLIDGFPHNECRHHRHQSVTTRPKFNYKAERAKGIANLDRLLTEACDCGPANECPHGETVIETSVEVSVRCTQCGRTGVRSTFKECREGS